MILAYISASDAMILFIIPSPTKFQRDIHVVTLPSFRNILVNTLESTSFKWILTKLGTYLVLKRIWNPIDFQGHQVKFLGEGIRHTLRCTLFLSDLVKYLTWCWIHVPQLCVVCMYYAPYCTIVKYYVSFSEFKFHIFDFFVICLFLKKQFYTFPDFYCS